jgi:hypothetical protein
MDKINMPKKESVENVSRDIFNFLNKNREFNANNAVEFRKTYFEKCSSQGISAYTDMTFNFLKSRNLLIFEKQKCLVLMKFNLEELTQALIDWRLRNDTRKKDNSQYRKTNIVRKRAKKTETNVEDKLIPLNKVLAQIPINKIIDFFGISNVVNCLREEYNLEITAERITKEVF